MNWFIIGRVTKPHGVRGAVKVFPETDFPQRFSDEKTLVLDVRGEKETHAVEYVRFQGSGMLIVKLKDIDTMEKAEQLRGAEILVDEEHLYPLEEGAYYYHELVGCTVTDEKKGDLGVLKDVFFNGGTDIYVVETPEKKEILIPAVESMVRKVDVKNRVITVEIFEGLIQ